jgi:hypothetical protein
MMMVQKAGEVPSGRGEWVVVKDECGRGMVIFICTNMVNNICAPAGGVTMEMGFFSFFF